MPPQPPAWRCDEVRPVKRKRLYGRVCHFTLRPCSESFTLLNSDAATHGIDGPGWPHHASNGEAVRDLPRAAASWDDPTDVREPALHGAGVDDVVAQPQKDVVARRGHAYHVEAAPHELVPQLRGS